MVRPWDCAGLEALGTWSLQTLQMYLSCLKVTRCRANSCEMVLAWAAQAFAIMMQPKCGSECKGLLKT